MREIKFRAWCPVVNLMTYFHVPTIEFNSDGLPGVFFSSANKSVALATYKEPQQYTGLKDKNSIEVFEGDILKNGKNLFVVEWSEGMAGFKCVAIEDINHYPAFTIGTIKSLEVVGNVYENPELLGPGQVSIFERS